VVTNLADSGAGSLRQAILNANAAASADTITFDPLLAGTIILSPSNPFVVTDHVSIVGNKAVTLDANNASQIFDIDNAAATEINVSISNLAFMRGNGAGPAPFNDGGSIYSAENLTIKNCVFRDNTITGVGNWGAVLAVENVDSITKIVNSKFIDNSSGSLAGAIYARGSLLQITTSTFSGNSALSAGAAYFSSIDKVKINGSTFTDNHATAGNGGALVFSSVPNGLVLNYFIDDNSAAGAGFAGGAVHLASSFVSLTGSKLRDNTADGDGGGLFIDAGSSAVLVRTGVARNHSGGSGGGVSFDGSLAVIHSSITRNDAVVFGGGIRGDVASTGDFVLYGLDRARQHVRRQWRRAEPLQLRRETHH
jgi:hypothetical protein